MPKQTKMIKTMFIVFMLIPIILLLTGVIQTLVLKSKQNDLLKARNNLSNLEEEYDIINQKYDYVYNEDGTLSEDYLKEYYKYNGNYGDEGDIDITLK